MLKCYGFSMQVFFLCNGICTCECSVAYHYVLPLDMARKQKYNDRKMFFYGFKIIQLE